MARLELKQPLRVQLRQNWLTVNRRALCAEALGDKPNKTVVTAEQLAHVLAIGRVAILNGIEDFYDTMRADNPGVVRPSIFTVQLGDTLQTDGRHTNVFTEKGYNNGGIIQAVDELQPSIHPYWNAVMDAGFLPEVRRTSGKEHGGSWLMLRKPTLAQVSGDWLGVPLYLPDETAENQELTALQKEAAVDMYREGVYGKIDEFDDMQKAQSVSGPERAMNRSRLQISSLVGVLAYKQALAYADGDLDSDIEYAIQYAKAYFPAARLAIENALY